MARYKAGSAHPEPHLTHISIQEKGDSPHTRIIEPKLAEAARHTIEPEPQEAADYGEAQHVASMGVKLYYRAKQPVQPKGRYSEIRRYYAGLVCIGWVGRQNDGSGWRLSIHDGDCPIRVYEFKKEKELETFLTEAVSGRPR